MAQARIEIEKKFLIKPNFENLLLQEGANVVAEKEFCDKYYDFSNYKFSLQNVWLRSRNNQWELKYLGKEAKTHRSLDSYCELDVEANILEVLKDFVPDIKGKSLRNVSEFVTTFDLRDFASFTTKRTKYRLEDVTIDLDCTSFGYHVGELEIIVDNKEKNCSCRRKIGNFGKETCDRSLNESWVRPQRKQKYTGTKKMDDRVKSAPVARTKNVSKSSALDSEEDEIGDTVEEFKLTLQWFKRLTNQVREVNHYMNNHRIYSFKHHMNNEGIASPALRRSQLAAALSRNRVIPATQGPNEPITDLGPMPVTRPASCQERKLNTSYQPPLRPTSSISSRPSSSPSQVYHKQVITKRSESAKAMEKEKEKQLREADDLAKEKWIELDKDFEKLFVPDDIDIEAMPFRFHDPYPKNWVDETVEDVCFRGKRKVDPYMHRLDEFEDLQEETVLWEKLQNEKLKPFSASLPAKNPTKKTLNTRSSKSATGLSRAKSQGNKIKRSYSAGRGSISNGVSGSEESDIVTFRNSGYDMKISFELGSMYPETRPTLQKNKPNVVVEKTVPVKAKPRAPHCEACHYRRNAKKHRNCKSSIPTLKAMRAQYNLKATECYDVVEIAQSFDPPCQDKMEKTSKKTLTTDEKAAKKGIVSGKNNFSQRRISLTSEGMAVRGINPILNNLEKTNTKKKTAKTVKR